MLTTGLTLAVLTAVGFYAVYRKLPARMRKFMVKHALITDAVACTLTYMLFGGTIIGLFAAAFCGIIVSLTLAMVNNPKINAFLEKTWNKSAEAWKDLSGQVTETKVLNEKAT